MDHRGETGAQSSAIPALVAFLKVPHRGTWLTDHLADMRRFMPAEHRAFLARVERMPSISRLVNKELFNEALEALATFRETHLGFAQEYIARWVHDPRGTGGTPYLAWFDQLTADTRACKTSWVQPGTRRPLVATCVWLPLPSGTWVITPSTVTRPTRVGLTPSQLGGPLRSSAELP